MARSALMTTSWDDGCRQDGRISAILSQAGVTGTFYATTGEGGRRIADDATLRKIAIEHELGNHGQTHTPFVELSPERILSEIEWGLAELARFGSDSLMVAPPKGKLDGRVVETLRTVGYPIRTAPVLGRRRAPPGFLEPTVQLFPHGWLALLRNVGRRRRIPAIPLLLSWSRGGGFRDRTVRLVREAIRRLPYLHVWGHADDLDRYELWDFLPQVLDVAVAAGATPVTNTEAFAALEGNA